MKVYLVGGAVRDGLLGCPCTDRDWLVTGSSEAELLALGFRAVGRSFGVYLHPETNEEYALPRGKDGTIEADLAARDLTINAMAQDSDGRLIDPHGGQQDLEARLLRHVGENFADDPARILRVARFAAEFTDQGFSVAPQTTALMTKLVGEGALRQLSPDRVWGELVKLLSVGSPTPGIEVLTACGVVRELLTDWSSVPSSSQDFAWEEGCSAMEAADRGAEAPASASVRLASYLLGIRGTRTSLGGLTVLLKQCRVPGAGVRLIEWTQDGSGGGAALLERSPEQILDLLRGILRRGHAADLGDFIAVATAAAPASGREWGAEQRGLVRRLAQAVEEYSGPLPGEEGSPGEVLSARIRARQVQALGATLRSGPQGRHS
jgi:hypothetical protein